MTAPNDRWAPLAAQLRAAMLKAAGAISDEELLSLRKQGSRLEGHPTPRAPFVDVASSSLGQGLPAAVGIALGARLIGRELRCWVLLGDSEMAEGSVYEALELGATTASSGSSRSWFAPPRYEITPSAHGCGRLGHER